jgi:hypothetical protein
MCCEHPNNCLTVNPWYPAADLFVVETKRGYEKMFFRKCWILSQPPNCKYRSVHRQFTTIFRIFFKIKNPRAFHIKSEGPPLSKYSGRSTSPIHACSHYLWIFGPTEYISKDTLFRVFLCLPCESVKLTYVHHKNNEAQSAKINNMCSFTPASVGRSRELQADDADAFRRICMTWTDDYEIPVWNRTTVTTSP